MGCGASACAASDATPFSDISRPESLKQAPASFMHSVSPFKANLQHLSNLSIMGPRRAHSTAIVATVGPRVNTPGRIADLRRAGVSIIRINMSHGSREFHQSVLENLKQSYDIYPGSPVAVAIDTRGPEIRLGFLVDDGEGKGVAVTAGQTLTLVTNASQRQSGSAQSIFVSYAGLPAAVKPGQKIFVDDGALTLSVEEANVNEGWIRTTVVNNGKLLSNKGVILPGAKIDLPALSEQDRDDLKFAIDNQVDMIFASFLKTATDIKLYRQTLVALCPAAAASITPGAPPAASLPTSSGTAIPVAVSSSSPFTGASVKVIVKIDSLEALTNSNELMREADGALLARGDLGVSLPMSKLFVAQKMLCARANRLGKPVICAQQMLQSMVQNPRPTRAEVCDVANAVMDGVDCVMLSSETSCGQFPIEAVELMRETTIEADSAVWHDRLFHDLTRSVRPDTTEAVAISTVNATMQQDITAIICLTTTGDSCKWLSKYRPRCPIIGVTRSLQTARQLHLYRNVYPCISQHSPPERFASNREWQADVNRRVHFAIGWAVQHGLLEAGKMQNVIVVQGWSRGQGHTNTLRIVATDGILRDGKAFPE